MQMGEGRAHRQARGRIDYTLRIRANAESQPVAVAIIEAKAESLPPPRSGAAKGHAACKLLIVPFIYATNGAPETCDLR